MIDDITVENFSKTSGQLMVNLAERWLDESQYEDIGEYQKVIQKKADSFGVTVTKMVKKPFGCEFTVNGNRYRYTVKLNRSSAVTKVICLGKA
jgi:hypothetical protein